MARADLCVVVHKLAPIRRNPLPLHLFQLPPKYVLVEEELQLFVGSVDAKLLERVDGETLKPKDVEDTDREDVVVVGGGGGGVQEALSEDLVETGHKPAEQIVVDLRQ